VSVRNDVRKERGRRDWMDQIVTPTQARKDLFKIIKRINENNEPVVIKPTKADEKSVVVIGEDDWKAIQETLFLVNHGVDKQIKERENEPLDDFDDVWGQL
jgi:antitoxin YefM